MNKSQIFTERREETLQNRINEFLQDGKEVVCASITSSHADYGAGYVDNLVALIIYKEVK